MDELWIETDYGRLYARAAGEPAAPLVLAVHGLSQRNGWHSWEPLMRPLAEGGYYVVSLDMPGWGRSSATGFDAMDLLQGAAVLLAVTAHLGRHRARALMGKSWGGALALTAALDAPDSVEKLILTAPAFLAFNRLAALRHPVLLAWANDDPAIPVTVADQYAAVPDLQRIIYETGGHSAAPNNAGDFAPRAIAFLDRSAVEKHS